MSFLQCSPSARGQLARTIPDSVPSTSSLHGDQLRVQISIRRADLPACPGRRYRLPSLVDRRNASPRFVRFRRSGRPGRNPSQPRLPAKGRLATASRSTAARRASPRSPDVPHAARRSRPFRCDPSPGPTGRRPRASRLRIGEPLLALHRPRHLAHPRRLRPPLFLLALLIAGGASGGWPES